MQSKSENQSTTSEGEESFTEFIQFPDEIIRDIFRVPYWYRLGEQEYLRYCSILQESGEEKAHSVREKSCEEVGKDCTCYHCNRPGYLHTVVARTAKDLQEEEAERSG